MKTLFCLATFLIFQTANAADLRPCDSKDILKIACGQGGLLTPTEKTKSGLTMTAADLKRSETRNEFTKVGKDKIKDTVKRTRQMYFDFIKTIPQGLQGRTTKAIEMIETLADPAGDIDSSDVKCNAFFDPDNVKTAYEQMARKGKASIGYSAAVVNYKNLSTDTLDMITAHEMAHRFVRLGAAQVKKYFGEALATEYESTIKNTKTKGEDGADWLAGKVLAHHLTRINSEKERRDFVISGLRFFCELPEKSFKQKVVGVLNDTHSQVEARFDYITRAPEMRKALGCLPYGTAEKSPVGALAVPATGERVP